MFEIQIFKLKKENNKKKKNVIINFDFRRNLKITEKNVITFITIYKN
jgi:hypothetical protein